MLPQRFLNPQELRLLIIGLLYAAVVVVINLLVDQLESDTSVPMALYSFSGAALFWSIPLFAFSQRVRLRNALDRLGTIAGELPIATTARPLLSLFIVSFAVLFIE